ncbi:unnamed protein product [Effrenium voratum]|nr:unnamed protein product [Effrenium voratum]
MIMSLRMPDGSPSLGKPGKDASKAPSTPGVPQLPFDSPNGKEKRCLLSIFELFEQLSSGAVTPWELTEPSPLDVFVHKLEDGSPDAQGNATRRCQGDSPFW